MSFPNGNFDRALSFLDELIETPVFLTDTGAIKIEDLEQYDKLQPGVDPKGDVFSEEPVPLDVFIHDKMYLSQPRLSEEQFKAVELASSIYFPETYDLLSWVSKREEWWNPSYTELVFQWGKGSGKDFVCKMVCARVAYLLLCLREPQKYYNMGPDESIDILNVARSTSQATKVFFQPLVRIVARSPWFKDKYDDKIGLISYAKNINAHSGHADQESLEGFNLLLGVADEIASFKTKEELRTRPSSRPGQHSADAIAEMMISSGQSRFPKMAKVVYISYPRFRGDFITQKSAAAMNEPTMYSTTRATWEVNPTKSRSMFDDEYRKNPDAAAAKYECKPPAATNKFFRNDLRIDEAFQGDVAEKDRALSPVDDLGFLIPGVRFDHGKPMAAHLDLALTNDRAGVCLAHMQDWSIRQTVDGHTLREPIIFIDIITSFGAQDLGMKELDLSIVEDFLVGCIDRGANLRIVTADQFQSAYMLQNIQNRGIETKRRSIDRDTSAYDNLKSALYSHRVIGYYRERVMNELKALKLVNGVKVDHEPGGSKDESDALAGAVAGVTEIAFADFASQMIGEKVDWSNPHSAFHDELRGHNPWGRVANFDPRQMR